MSDFAQYRRSQIAELRPYIDGEVLGDRVSISAADREAGSPKPGDMIARNPKNHDDQWLVAAKYFADNFEPIAAQPVTQPPNAQQVAQTGVPEECAVADCRSAVIGIYGRTPYCAFHMSIAASPAPTKLADGRPAGFVKPDNDRQVFFYEQDFYVLSNFSAFNVEINGQIFETSEAAYHWLKFPEAPEVQLAILHARSAHEAFKIAEGHKHLRRADWDDVKADYMLEILREKAEQHEYVRRKLLATGDRELIEDSWRDDFWGWGPNRDGQNVLGKLWMQVRAELLAAAPTPEGN